MKNSDLSKVERVALQYFLTQKSEAPEPELLKTAYEFAYRFLDESKSFQRKYD